ncbi:MAG TPA: TfoX/Sxy family protein [Allosphingosinicella sp.]|nr:TfoX/Sxy family protein [Allosphingosinicella sp.]
MAGEDEWKSDPKALRARIEQAMILATEDDDITFKAMFGGVMCYTSGRPFASLSNAGIALKLDPADRQALIDGGRGWPLRYEPGDPPSKSYTILPEREFGPEDADLRMWLQRSIAYCRAQPAKPRKGRKQAP